MNSNRIFFESFKEQVVHEVANMEAMIAQLIEDGFKDVTSRTIEMSTQMAMDVHMVAQEVRTQVSQNNELLKLIQKINKKFPEMEEKINKLTKAEQVEKKEGETKTKKRGNPTKEEEEEEDERGRNKRNKEEDEANVDESRSSSNSSSKGGEDPS
mmetsp:Transcript_50588/g.64811  ORF Transcript_50588/g.64811 Transcript_50588/m.64811 type:complete len:155 (-) Transcript_50588:217-681(-)